MGLFDHIAKPWWFPIVEKIVERESAYDVFIIGSEGVGKTRLYKGLRNEVYSETKDKGTTFRRTEKKEITFVGADGKEKTITLGEGCDIGGQETYRNSYDKYIHKNTYVILVFSLFDFLNNNKSKKTFLGRLQYILDKGIPPRHVYIVGSNVDRLGKIDIGNKRNEVVQDIVSDNASFQKYLEDEHFTFMNLKQKKQVDRYREQLFNQKSLWKRLF